MKASLKYYEEGSQQFFRFQKIEGHARKFVEGLSHLDKMLNFLLADSIDDIAMISTTADEPEEFYSMEKFFLGSSKQLAETDSYDGYYGEGVIEIENMIFLAVMWVNSSPGYIFINREEFEYFGKANSKEKRLFPYFEFEEEN